VALITQDVDRLGLGATEAGETARSSRTVRSLAWDQIREAGRPSSRNSVPPVCGVKEPVLGVPGVRKGTPLLSRTCSASSSVSGIAGTVDVHEGGLPSGVHAMHEPGDEPLAGAVSPWMRIAGGAGPPAGASSSWRSFLPDGLDGRALS